MEAYLFLDALTAIAAAAPATEALGFFALCASVGAAAATVAAGLPPAGLLGVADFLTSGNGSMGFDADEGVVAGLVADAAAVAEGKGDVDLAPAALGLAADDDDDDGCCCLDCLSAFAGVGVALVLDDLSFFDASTGLPDSLAAAAAAAASALAAAFGLALILMASRAAAASGAGAGAVERPSSFIKDATSA